MSKMSEMSYRAFAGIVGVSHQYIEQKLLGNGTNPALHYIGRLKELNISESKILAWVEFFQGRIKTPDTSDFSDKEKAKESRNRIWDETSFNTSFSSEQMLQLNKMKATKRKKILAIIQIVREAQEKGVSCAGATNKKLQDILKNAKQKYGYELSIIQYKKVVKKIQEKGIQSYLDDWDKKGNGNLGKTIVNKTDLDVYVAHFIRDNYIASNQAYRITIGQAIKHGRFNPEEQAFPSEKTFINQAQKIYGKEYINAERLGKDYWKRNDAPYITRDISNLRPMQVLVGDCMTCDTWVRIPNAKIQKIGEKEKFQPDFVAVRPFLTAWIDFKTGRFVGYEFHIEDENTGHILSTLKMAVSRFGKPEMIYVDNGKTYANRELERILPTLGIKKKHATKYNAQAKFIERIFGIFHQELDKNSGTYAGTTKLRVPESTEKKLKDLSKNINIEAVPTFEEYVENSIKFIEEIYAKRVFENGMRAQQSPLSLWNKEYDGLKMEFASEDALSLMLARSSEPFTVQRHQINDRKNDISYNAERLVNGTKVYLRRDPKDLTKAFAYGLDDNYLATLTANPIVAGIYENDEEIAVFETAMKTKRGHEKTFIREKAKELKSVVKTHGLTPEESAESQQLYGKYRSAQLKLNHKEKELQKTIQISQYDRDIAEAKRQEEFGKTEIPVLRPLRQAQRPVEWSWDNEEEENEQLKYA